MQICRKYIGKIAIIWRATIDNCRGCTLHCLQKTDGKPKFTAVDLSIHTEFYDRLREFCAALRRLVVLVVEVVTDRRLSSQPDQDRTRCIVNDNRCIRLYGGWLVNPFRPTLSHYSIPTMLPPPSTSSSPYYSAPETTRLQADSCIWTRSYTCSPSWIFTTVSPLHYFRSRYPLLVNYNQRE